MSADATSDSTSGAVPAAIVDRIHEVRELIAAAAVRAGRDPFQVRLIGASKRQPVEAIRAAVDAGLVEFGENYVQELAQKQGQGVPGATWHYFGALQSGTATQVADEADWVHGLVPGRATKRLARRAAANGSPVRALIEVDFTGGEHAGVPPEGLEAFAEEAAALEGLEILGLMTIPPAPEVAEDSRRWFAALRELGEKVLAGHPAMVQLSMGMSLDYEVAVEEGATMVRVGTALFGERPVSRLK